MASSRWVAAARRVVRATLAGLPETATDAEKRRAVSLAYPFGERAYTPYKVWLSVVRQELGPSRRVPAPSLAVRKNGETYSVACGWCRGAGRRCLVCGPVLDGLAALSVRLPSADVPSGVAADWLEDEGFPQAAAALRAAP